MSTQPAEDGVHQVANVAGMAEMQRAMQEGDATLAHTSGGEPKRTSTNGTDSA